ncbi:acetyl-CoA acetyltransferase [Rhizobium sp. BK650]|nr:acetyl-CoA acetyltransferase [Rhizobium sp. BK650]
MTAGNASGVNDGAAALIIASEPAAGKYGLTPIARVLSAAAGAVAPRVMGIGPVPVSRELMVRLGSTQEQFDMIELNESFASQALAALR